jgi:hypothetical protein
MAPTKKALIDAEPTLPLKENLRSSFKYSPQKKTTDKSNQVFVKEYKFGVISLTLKKG